MFGLRTCSILSKGYFYFFLTRLALEGLGWVQYTIQYIEIMIDTSAGKLLPCEATQALVQVTAFFYSKYSKAAATGK